MIKSKVIEGTLSPTKASWSVHFTLAGNTALSVQFTGEDAYLVAHSLWASETQISDIAKLTQVTIEATIRDHIAAFNDWRSSGASMAHAPTLKFTPQ